MRSSADASPLGCRGGSVHGLLVHLNLDIHTGGEVELG